MSVFSARYRAARGWADLTQGDLAERLGLEKQAIVRTEAGRRDPKKGELIAVAAVCDVPVQFMLDGFGDIERSDLLDRLERIEAALSDGPSVDYTRLAMETERALTARALQSAGVDGATEDGESSRDEADATPGAPEAPAPETPRTELGDAG